MRALVPLLVSARHHGLLFALPFLRVVGFFNEHFDPTQVWRWCLCDPEEKTQEKGKRGGKRKRLIPFSVWDLWAVVSSGAVSSGPGDLVFILGPRVTTARSRPRVCSPVTAELARLCKVKQQMTNVNQRRVKRDKMVKLTLKHFQWSCQIPSDDEFSLLMSASGVFLRLFL